MDRSIFNQSYFVSDELVMNSIRILKLANVQVLEFYNQNQNACLIGISAVVVLLLIAILTKCLVGKKTKVQKQQKKAK